MSRDCRETKHTLLIRGGRHDGIYCVTAENGQLVKIVEYNAGHIQIARSVGRVVYAITCESDEETRI